MHLIFDTICVLPAAPWTPDLTGGLGLWTFHTAMVARLGPQTVEGAYTSGLKAPPCYNGGQTGGLRPQVEEACKWTWVAFEGFG